MDDGGPKKPKQSGTITFLPFTDILKRERREMLVPDLLFNAGVTTLVGQSGNGKSTLCMAIAPQTMIGGRWGDQLIKPRPVIWVAGEGQDVVKMPIQPPQ